MRITEVLISLALNLAPTTADCDEALSASAAARRAHERLDTLDTSATQLKNMDNTFETTFGKVAKNFSVVDNKLGQIPIISRTLQEHTNSIEEVIAENRLLREEIRSLSDRLDFYEKLNKFICYSSYPSILYGQAKELYGLICPTAEHDEL